MVEVYHKVFRTSSRRDRRLPGVYRAISFIFLKLDVNKLSTNSDGCVSLADRDNPATNWSKCRLQPRQDSAENAIGLSWPAFSLMNLPKNCIDGSWLRQPIDLR